MRQPWQHLTPVYAEYLSSSYLQAQGKLFHVGDARSSPVAPKPPHWHESYELGWVRSGRGVYMVGQSLYPYQAGQIYVANSLEPHMAFAEDTDSEFFIVHFHSMILDEGWIARSRTEARLPFLGHMGLKEPLLALENPLCAEIRSLLTVMRGEAQTKGPLWDVVVGGLLIQAVGLLGRETPKTELDNVAEQRRRALRRITESLKLIEERFAEALSLEDIASASHLSEAHCCVLFQEALATSPISYRNSRRITEAQRLLQTADLSVQEIAYAVGFTSVQEFNRLFRRSFGVTPSSFRAAIGQPI